jgi:nitroreductase
MTDSSVLTVASVVDALLQRISVGSVTDPAPSAAQREAIFSAALRAPDHGQLRPWRFLLVEGEQRLLLGKRLAEVEEACYGPLTDAQRNKVAERPLRAPLLLLIVAKISQHAKVPELEQMLSTAAAVQNMLIAAHAVGVGAMWRTGNVTYEPLLAEKLGLPADERLLGFLYLGTPAGLPKALPTLATADFFRAWLP